jgi:hypothetical protein
VMEVISAVLAPKFVPVKVTSWETPATPTLGVTAEMVAIAIPL